MEVKNEGYRFHTFLDLMLINWTPEVKIIGFRKSLTCPVALEIIKI